MASGVLLLGPFCSIYYMEKDLNKIAAIEKAINKKYGSEAIQNPKSGWTAEKEKEFKQQLNELEIKKRKLEVTNEKILKDGFYIIPNKPKVGLKSCSCCRGTLKTIRDDIYYLKYEACEKCFIQHIEERESRWLDGWRPGEK
jgi:hypothetical protein